MHPESSVPLSDYCWWTSVAVWELKGDDALTKVKKYVCVFACVSVRDGDPLWNPTEKWTLKQGKCP